MSFQGVFLGSFSLSKKCIMKKCCTKNFIVAGPAEHSWSGVQRADSPLVALRRGRNSLKFRKNGARGEKCGSISRGGEQDRLPFLKSYFILTLQNVPVERFEDS